MRYLHHVDVGVFPPDEFHSHFIGFWETGVDSCVVILSRVPPGKGTSIGLHTHQVDQYYVTISGEMTVRLGNDVSKVSPGSVVHIPATLPHWNWNAGAVDEWHLELVVPSPMGMADFGRPLDRAPVDAELQHIRPGTIRKIDDPPRASVDRGGENATVDLVRLTPGGRGEALRAHDTDRFYYVLDGCLSAQIGLERYQAGPHSLFIIPAGTLHREWNDGDQEVRQVTMSVPRRLPDPVAV